MNPGCLPWFARLPPDPFSPPPTIGGGLFLFTFSRRLMKNLPSPNRQPGSFRRLAWSLVLLPMTGCFVPKPAADESQQQAAEGERSNAVSAADATPRETLNQTTQNVLALNEALSDGGELATGGDAGGNPLLQSAGAYRSSVAKLGGIAVDQAIQIRNAQSIRDPQPLDHATFVAEIIKPDQPDGIRLPMLPYYQEYAWDEQAQKLVVVEFPARVAEREKNR